MKDPFFIKRVKKNEDIIPQNLAIEARTLNLTSLSLRSYHNYSKIKIQHLHGYVKSFMLKRNYRKLEENFSW